MEFKDKINQSVAAAVAKIMGEALHPNQQKLDVHEPEKDELTAADFKKLRSGKKPDMKKEEIEIEEESHQSKTTMKHIPNPTPAQKQAAKDIKPGVGGYRDRIAMLKDAGVKEEVKNEEVKDEYARKVDKYLKKKHAPDAPVKEEVEAIDEVKMADLPSTKVQGRSYGASKPQPSAFDVLKGPKDKELKSIETEKKKPVNEEDAYDKNVKPSDKPHDKDAAKKRAQTSAVAARKVMSMSTYSASKKGK